MNEQKRQAKALFRFSVIGPLISGEHYHGEQKKLIRELAQRRYTIPYSPRTHIGVGTISEWLLNYRKTGLEGLKPKTRSDIGNARGIRSELEETILALKTEKPKISVDTIFYTLVRERKMVPGEVSRTAVYRLLANKLKRVPVPKTGNYQRRFSHRYPNDCWQGDVMYAPYIMDDDTGRSRRPYLIAFIDDATRLIIGAEFFFSEATVNIKEVLRAAVVTYGVPSKLYLDNGRNFCAKDIQAACALMQCALIHATPYYPEGKGKIERFFRTVRSSFLTCISNIRSINQLNQYFDEWLTQRYNHAAHSALNGDTPIKTFLRKAENKIRRLPKHIDPAELFCKKEQRQVGKDGTFRINNIIYEAQEHLIGRKIGVLYDKDEPTKKVKVYDNGSFVHTATPIDYIANAKSKRKPFNKGDK